MNWEQIRDQIVIVLGDMIGVMIKRIRIRSEDDWKKFTDVVEKIDKLIKEIKAM